MDKQVNDWGAAKELEKFKQIYLDPLHDKVNEALGILGDDNRKWKKGEKDRAKAKFKRIEFDYINYTTLYQAVLKLIEQHEAQTDMLTEVYTEWWEKIAREGMQPLEIMKMQQQIIQEIWHRIYAAIEPLKLEQLKPPAQL